MNNGIIKADGTSRLMRANLPASYEEFRAMAAAGTLPLDILFNAAGWTQQPTLLNKATLLKDETASLLGLGADAVPDDAFSLLSRFHGGLGNEHIWLKIMRETEEVVHYDEASYPNSAFMSYSIGGFDIYYSDAFTVENNTFVLTNPSKRTHSSQDAYGLDVLAGKYVIISTASGKYMDYFPAGTTFSYDSNLGNYNASTRIQYSNPTISTIYHDTKQYVNSPNADSYPPSVDDGCTYEYRGRLGNAAQFATGSYTGTGKYGSSNPNSLTFDFEPKLVIISGIVDTSVTPGSSVQLHTGIWSATGCNGMQVIQSNSFAYNNNATAWSIHAEVTNNTFSWHTGQKDSGGSTRHQLNNSGQKYCWVAIG